MKIIIALVCITIVSSAASVAQEFRLLAWNVESNRPGVAPVSDASVIAGQLTALLADQETRSQIVVLSEVEPRTFSAYREAVRAGLQTEVDFVTSASGGFQDSDSLMVVVDKARFEIDQALELHRFAGIAANFNVHEADTELGSLRVRSPLAVRLQDKWTKQSFWVVANHLARGEADLRTDQARMLVKWAEALKEPAISAGDHNFDYDVKTARGNAGFDAMSAGNVWRWLKPDPLVDTNWSDDREVRDRRVDRYPDSILDFVWVANGAQRWQGDSDVIVRAGDFPDNETTSDHRPIIASLVPDAR